MVMFASSVSHATGIFGHASKEQLAALPKEISAKDCVVHVNQAETKSLGEAKWSKVIKLLHSKGYTIDLVEYQVMVGVGGFALEYSRDPKKIGWEKDDLVLSLHLHTAKPGDYVGLYRNGHILGDNPLYEGRAFRNYCEISYEFLKATAGNATNKISGLRMTNRSLIGMQEACTQSLQDLSVAIPVCKKLN